MRPGHVIRTAVDSVVSQRREFFKALLKPVIILTVLDLLDHVIWHSIVSLFLYVLGVCIQAILAITTHRLVLLGPDSVPTWGLGRWTSRETLFAAYLAGLSLIFTASLMGAVFFNIEGFIAAILLVLWLISRFILVFPAIAVDQSLPLIASWKLTSKYQLQMIAAAYFIPVLIGIPILFLSKVPNTFLLTSVLATIATVFTTAAISVAFREILREYDT